MELQLKGDYELLSLVLCSNVYLVVISVNTKWTVRASRKIPSALF